MFPRMTKQSHGCFPLNIFTISHFGADSDEERDPMIQVVFSVMLLVLAQQDKPESEVAASKKWIDFYQSAVKHYKVTRVADQQVLNFDERAVLNWASIDDYHGAVFTWTENGRPAAVGTIFSFPARDGKQRLAVHEFASFAESEVRIDRPGTEWIAPGLKIERLPGAPTPPNNASLIKLQCRRLAKDFSAHMNRRGERWDLRLLPTPLIDYQQTSEQVLGGGLFAFVGYSTDPEILLLLEARKTEDGPVWYYNAVRFSDKSLYLHFKDKPLWESMRTGHGFEGTNTADPNYRVLFSERIP
jgi:hypothetical protein